MHAILKIAAEIQLPHFKKKPEPDQTPNLMDTLERFGSKSEGAKDLKSVVSSYEGNGCFKHCSIRNSRECSG